jgi:hypothetical protein
MEKKEHLGDKMEQKRLEQEIAGISQLHQAVNAKLEEYIVGNRQLITFILAAMLSEGHIDCTCHRVRL